MRTPITGVLAPGLLLFAFCISAFPLLGQTTQDVLYLKNGWILRGEILEWKPEGTVKIQTADQNIFVFRDFEVLKSEKEEISEKRSGTTPIMVKGRGYYSVNSLGLQMGSQDFGSAATLSISSFHGFRFSPFFGLGGGFSLDLFEEGFLMPVMVDIRGDLLTKPVTPIWYAQGGISVPLYSLDAYENPWQPPGQTNHRTAIGEAWELGTGFKVRTRRNLAWVVSLGYRVQVVTHHFDYGDGGRTEQELTYQRIALRIGLEL